MPKLKGLNCFEELGSNLHSIHLLRFYNVLRLGSTKCDFNLVVSMSFVAIVTIGISTFIAIEIQFTLLALNADGVILTKLIIYLCFCKAINVVKIGLEMIDVELISRYVSLVLK